MGSTPAQRETEPRVPADLRKSLAAVPMAAAGWRGLTPIARRDFLNWIGSAKQAETRRRRIDRACENLAAGKRRPCCYAVVPMDFYKALGADPKAKGGWSGLTPGKRRDVVERIEAADGKDTRKERIKETLGILAAGKQRRGGSANSSSGLKHREVDHKTR